MILTNEDYDGLMQIQLILAGILKNAVMSELEEKHEREFEKLNNALRKDRAFEEILRKRRKQMPSKFREIFNEQWFKNHTRTKKNGIYEIRCSIDKVPISGSGKTLDIASQSFIEQLVLFHSGQKAAPQKEKRVIFCEFSEKWFKLVKKPTVKPITYDSFITVYRVHIKTFFNRKYVDELTALQIQPLFNKIAKEGKLKTAQTVKLLLNQIFKAAIAERIITFNPMDGVKVLKHHNKNGTALTCEEEKQFLARLENSRFKLTFAIMLFGGMRRAELATVKLDENFIIVKNGKKRLSDIKSERKIPITPMLKPYLATAKKSELREAIKYSCDQLSREFKALCPAHHLHELRHTFITRCQECGVPREVVSVWAGHSSDSSMTSTVYTHFSEEFMISEAKKVDYYNRLKS